VGIDPLELRRRNVLQKSDLPYQAASGMVFDDVTPAECLEQAAQLIDYEGFRRHQAEALAEGRLLGIGIGLYIEPTSGRYGALGIEAAHVRVEPSGTVSVSLGTGSHGQSIETTMAQVVADSLGVDVDRVRVRQGDTDIAPFGGGTGGSRTAVIAGGAARAASAKVRDKAVEIAAHMLEAASDDVVVEEGSFFVRGTPSRAVTLAQIAMTTYTNPDGLPAGMEPGLEAVGRYSPPPFTWANSCHICTCEIDTDTGIVQLIRYVVSEDCGVMINPMVVEGQVAGGVVQGIGGVLLEHIVYDDDGNPLTTTFLDYTLPTASDVPIIEYGHLETPAPNPGGHKGVGEGGAIGSVPAVFNAVADALAQVGARATRMPLNPSQVLDALDAVDNRVEYVE
jgi:carbon-monoxide dehydrogenase large subunit